MQLTLRGLAALVAVTLLAIAGTLQGCGGPDARRASHIARGQQYLADGKPEKARIEFANALQISAQDAQVRYLLGQVSERLGDLRAAAAMYQGAIDVDRGSVGARAGLGRLYLLAGNAQKALDLVQPALAQHPDNAELLLVRALARLKLKDPTAAVTDAEHATRLAPSDPDAVSALAGIYRETGQAARAVALLQAAIEKTPDAIALRQFLAGIYALQGADAPAQQQLLKVVELRPKELAPRLQLAAFYARGQHLDEAERTLQAATADLPESEQAKLAYADFLARNRSPSRGEQALKALIAHDPGNYDLQLALGALEQRTGDTTQAVTTYRAIVARDRRGPKGVAARDRIAAIDVSDGRYTDAKPLLAEALDRSPHDNDALVMRANLALRDGDPVGAIADLRAVLRDQPGSVPILRSLARAYLANKSPVLAEESLRSAFAASPHDIDVQVDLGQLLTRTQRAEQAVTLLEGTVKDNPSMLAARTALIEAYLSKGDLAAARGAAEQLESQRPELPVGWYLAGLIAERQHRLEDAQREFESALQARPSDRDALAALARVEIAGGHSAQALALVRGAIERSPANAELHELLGELCLGLKSYPEASDALRDAVRLAPGWWLPYQRLALAKLAVNDANGALAAYEAGVKATAEPALAAGLAEAYAQQGRVDDAVRQYEALLKQTPSLAVAANNLAMLLVTYRTDQASLDRARDLTTPFATSDVAALLDTYGWVRLRRGEMTEALPALQRAVQEAPGAKVMLYHLGMAYLKAGQQDKARTNLEAALADGSSFSGTQDARLALARLKSSTG